MAATGPLVAGVSAGLVTWVPAVRDEAPGGTIRVKASDIDWTDGPACVTVRDDVDQGDELILCPFTYEEAKLHPRHAAGRLAISWFDGNETTEEVSFIVPRGREARLNLDLAGARLNTTVTLPDRIEAIGLKDSAFRWASGLGQMALLTAVPVLIVVKARWPIQAGCLVGACLLWPFAATAHDPIHYLAFPWPLVAAALVIWAWLSGDRPRKARAQVAQSGVPDVSSGMPQLDAIGLREDLR